jgi:hypothetical protein
MKIILISRRLHYVARVSILLIAVALVGGMTGCGDITQNLEIRTWYNLNAVRDNLGGSYILMNDLDSTTPGYEELAGPMANGGRGWEPISYEGGDEISFHFKGTFDGQGYEIHDLFINRPDRYWVGLFGLVDEGGIIKNVGLVRATVTGEYEVGGLVGYNVGTVSNSYFSGNVTGDEYVGGLLGVNTGTVSNSYSTGSVTGDNGVGGLVGRSREYGGGTISSSYSTGRVTGNSSGGLVGWNREGTVSNSHSTGTVTGDAVVGGLVGFNLAGTVSDSYSTSSVTGNSSGGLVGFNAGIVSNSHSTGTVTGDAVVGGLVGGNTGPVDNSYSTGSVIGSEYVGGLVAWNDGIVSNSFWDNETSGQSTSAGGTGKPTEEMINFDTFDGVGWDITAVDPGETDDAYTWNIVNGQTYPFLSWQL